MSDSIVSASGLGKCFKIYPSPRARLSEWLSLGAAKHHEDFWALRNISFELARGECMGVIGANGSGKSTLLKILTGSLFPSEGTSEVRGRVLSLLELGTGVNLELSGRANIINCSRLLDFPEGYAESKMERIERFAELGDFFDRPVRLYSSGMHVRLAFSMWTCFEPEVLIVDEALSVGDVFFQQKCFKRARELLDSGVAMLFVSHDLGAVQSLCKKTMVLEKGTCTHLGDVHAGIRLYFAHVGQVAGADVAQPPPAAPEPEPASAITSSETAPPQQVEGAVTVDHASSSPASVQVSSKEFLENLAWLPPCKVDAIGDQSMDLLGIACSGTNASQPGTDTQTLAVEQGQWLDIYTRWKASADLTNVNVGLALCDRTNRVIFARGLINGEIEPMSIKSGEEVLVHFRICMDIEGAQYSIMLSASESLSDPSSPNGWNQHIGGVRYLELPRAATISILPRSDKRVLFYGVAPLPNTMQVQKLSGI